MDLAMAVATAGPGAGVLLVLGGTLPAYARTRPQPVTAWVRHNAAPRETVDPTAPLDDLASLRRSIGNARIVGLGESAHGAAEEIALKHRALRLLVERMGFRSVAWEEDWTTGLQIDRYIRTGKGDLDALMRQMSPQWQSREVAAVLQWLRDYNAGHADKVRFVGVEYYLLGPWPMTPSRPRSPGSLRAGSRSSAATCAPSGPGPRTRSSTSSGT